MKPASNTITDELDPNVKFILFSKNVDLYSETLKLKRKVFLRNFLSMGEIIEHNKWVTGGKNASVEVRSKPVKGETEMIYVVPREPLREGAYTFIAGRESMATFFVKKQAVLANLEDSEDCVDVPVGLGGLAIAVGDWSIENGVPCNRPQSKTPPQSSSVGKSVVPPAYSKPQEPKGQSFVYTRTFPSPFETIWNGVLRVLDKQKDQKAAVTKKDGAITTKPSPHGTFFKPYYVKYDIQVVAESKTTSKIKLGVERFQRDTKCNGCLRAVKLVPPPAKWRESWTNKAADEFFSNLEAELR